MVNEGKRLPKKGSSSPDPYWSSDYVVPESFVPISIFNQNEPNFEVKFRYHKDKRLQIILDEPCPIIYYKRSANRKIGEPSWVELLPGVITTIKATDLWYITGAPNYCLDLAYCPVKDPTKPAQDGNWAVDPAFWDNQRLRCIDRVSRNRNMRGPVDHRIKGAYYSHYKSLWFNDVYGVWDKFPKILIDSSGDLISVPTPKIPLDLLAYNTMLKHGISLTADEWGPKDVSRVQAVLSHNSEIYGNQTLFNSTNDERRTLADGLVVYYMRAATIIHKENRATKASESSLDDKDD